MQFFYPNKAIFICAKFRLSKCFSLVPEIRVYSCEIVGRVVRLGAHGTQFENPCYRIPLSPLPGLHQIYPIVWSSQATLFSRLSDACGRNSCLVSLLRQLVTPGGVMPRRLKIAFDVGLN